MRPGEATPHKHAHAVLDALPAMVCYAGRKLHRFPDRKRPGEFVTHTSQEDLFGAFDAIAHYADGYERCVQWTSEGGSSARRAKVLERYVLPTCESIGFSPSALARKRSVEVWGWKARTGFRFWRFDWQAAQWEEQPIIQSPLIRRGRKAA